MRIAYKQTHPQSCTAVAIIVTLAEFGIKSFNSAVTGEELALHNKLKRSTKPGEEEIMPHKAAEDLREHGLQMTVIEDTGRTAVLKSTVATMYNAYTLGLKDIGLGQTLRPVELKDFLGDARVFLIVGFFEKGVLKLHTVLARLEGSNYYVMNPDGATDDAYSDTGLTSFLNASLMTSAGPNLLPFAGSGKHYVYSGIAVRIRPLDSSLLDHSYYSLPSSKLDEGNLIAFKTSRDFTEDFLKRMTLLDEIAKRSGLRLFVVGPDTQTCAAMSSQILSACEPLARNGYRLKMTPFVLAGHKELRIHYY